MALPAHGRFFDPFITGQSNNKSVFLVTHKAQPFAPKEPILLSSYFDAIIPSGDDYDTIIDTIII
jgi:hypothetical protein